MKDFFLWLIVEAMIIYGILITVEAIDYHTNWSPTHYRVMSAEVEVESEYNPEYKDKDYEADESEYVYDEYKDYEADESELNPDYDYDRDSDESSYSYWNINL